MSNENAFAQACRIIAAQCNAAKRQAIAAPKKTCTIYIDLSEVETECLQIEQPLEAWITILSEGRWAVMFPKFGHTRIQLKMQQRLRLSDPKNPIAGYIMELLEQHN